MIEIIPTVQGYKPDEIDERDKVYGKTEDPIILLSGNWQTLPIKDEFQAERGFENYGCVIFTTLNATEKLALLKFQEKWNKSERFTYIASETNPIDRGNSPRKVADSVRNQGIIDEIDLPFDDTITDIDKFNSPIPLPQFLKEKAKLWASKYDFSYDRLPITNGIVSRKTMRHALQRGCVGIAVYAWAIEDGLYIRPQGAQDTHLTFLENVRETGELEVFDSYPPALKVLHRNYPIFVAKRYNLNIKPLEEQLNTAQKSLIIILLEYVKQLVSKLYRVGGEILSGIFSKTN